MQTYHFGEDLLDTYQSLSFLLQTLWLIVPLVFVAAMFGLWLRYRIEVKQMGQQIAQPDPLEMAIREFEHITANPPPPTKEKPVLMAVVENDPSTGSG